MALKRHLYAAAGLAGLALGTLAYDVFSQAPAVAQPNKAAPVAAAPVRCARFPARNSSAFNRLTQRIDLPWRTDYPATAPARPSFGNFETDWRGYINGVISEVRASGFRIQNGRISVPSSARWWIAPWMDYGANGREPLNGLTKERNPDAGDLAPNSPNTRQVWAIGFYDVRGASAFANVYADPCNPSVPLSGFEFPEGSVSFKFLFTTATAADVPYLNGAPEVVVATNRARPDQPMRMRLLQIDIAVKDSNASETGWVFGTFIWQGPRRGDGLFDNLVPVGLMWGNDEGVTLADYNGFATLAQSRLNRDLDGVVWQRNGQGWQTRPWPGLQGRLNGPADNLRSSCMSCHALSQWPRSSLGIVPGSGGDLRTATTRNAIVVSYMTNTQGGTLVMPSEGQATPQKDAARPLDYSLQLEAAFTRMCQACSDGRLSGPTPALCRTNGIRFRVTAPSCPAPNPNAFSLQPHSETPPRQ